MENTDRELNWFIDRIGKYINRRKEDGSIFTTEIRNKSHAMTLFKYQEIFKYYYFDDGKELNKLQ